MNIYLDEEFYAKPDTTLLGYVGEVSTRDVDVYGLRLDGADSFSCLIEYNDGVKYEVDIDNSRFRVTASLLRSPQRVKCQLLAKASIEGTDAYRLVKKSNVFELDIKPSITGDPQPIPSYEETLSLLDQIKQVIDSGGVTATDEVISIITGILAEAIASDIEEDT